MREYGEQPLNKFIEQLNISNEDLVKAKKYLAEIYSNERYEESSMSLFTVFMLRVVAVTFSLPSKKLLLSLDLPNPVSMHI